MLPSGWEHGCVFAWAMGSHAATCHAFTRAEGQRVLNGLHALHGDGPPISPPMTLVFLPLPHDIPWPPTGRAGGAVRQRAGHV
jgi:hypothetical protein